MNRQGSRIQGNRISIGDLFLAQGNIAAEQEARAEAAEAAISKARRTVARWIEGCEQEGEAKVAAALQDVLDLLPSTQQPGVSIEGDPGSVARERDEALAALREINEYDVPPEVESILLVALLGDSSTQQQCDNCGDPAGESFFCYRCLEYRSGTGKENCERCKGSGTELYQGCGEWLSEECPDCDGTGKKRGEQ